MPGAGHSPDTMTQTEPLRGVPGILRPFKDYLQSSGLKEGDQIFTDKPVDFTPLPKAPAAKPAR